MSPRWTTARAVSRGADLRLRVAEPTSAPSKDRTGIVAPAPTSERMDNCSCLELGDLKSRRCCCFEKLLVLGLEKKMVEEKKDKEVAIFA